ncbi:MAG TPA: DUF349 domain-containing protein, partial [Cytophagaceae bacterium]|nr:DUF349 domain-containing protein [Cytophagaceae bacterium]
MENLEITDQLNNEIAQGWKEELEELNKKQLLDKINHWKLEDDYSESSSFLKEIRHSFDVLSEQERAIALQRFLETGGEEKDFDFKKDELTLAFDKAFNNLKDRLQHHYKEQDRSRQKNQEVKQALLEKLRQLVASEEGNNTLEEFKKIQAEWKAAGPVPGAVAHELNANFHGLLEIFYNNRAIYFELKDLDRKKNSQLKAEVVARIEALQQHKDAFEALRELRKLQEEYREIGAAVKEESEVIHVKYREAIEQLLKKKDAFIEELKAKREHSLTLKKALIQRLEEYKDYHSGKIDEWKEKTLAILKIQEEWKKTGPVAQELSKEINNKFWDASKVFFQNKNAFFKTLDEKRKDNLTLKISLCEQAEALKDSDDYQKASATLIRLQKEWTKVGQVPIKHKESIYKRFKEACDYFFNRQRDKHAESEKELEVNAQKKLTLVDAIKQTKDITVENLESKFNEWLKEWNGIGLIPRNKFADIQDAFSSALKGAVDNLSGLSAELKEEWLLKLDVLQAKGGGDSKAKVDKIEKDLLRKINGLKSE